MDNESQSEQIVFMGEPGEHVLVLTKLAADDIELLIFQHDGWSDSDVFTIAEKRIVFRDRTTLINVAKSVQNTADHLLSEYGVEGYKEQWHRYDFPFTQFNELKKKLNLLELKTNA